MEKPRIHPYIIIMIGVIFVALSAIFVKLTTADAGVVVFYRMLFSVVFMLPIFLLFYKKEVLLLGRRDWIFLQLQVSC